jgi:hypothetical protein
MDIKGKPLFQWQLTIYTKVAYLTDIVELHRMYGLYDVVLELQCTPRWQENRVEGIFTEPGY